MSDLKARCQRCHKDEMSWNVRQAEINVGVMRHWRPMLCEACTDVVQRAIFEALILKEPRSSDGT